MHLKQLQKEQFERAEKQKQNKIANEITKFSKKFAIEHFRLIGSETEIPREIYISPIKRHVRLI